MKARATLKCSHVIDLSVPADYFGLPVEVYCDTCGEHKKVSTVRMTDYK